MKLRRLRIDRAPGIDRPFELDDLADGLNVIVGPNGSGKSTLRRAVGETLWPGTGEFAHLRAESEWSDAGAHWRAEVAGRVSWQRDGGGEGAPSLPDRHLAACYSLALRDLLALDGAPDGRLAREIQVQMAGGIDLAAAAEPYALKARHAQNEERAYREARAARTRVETEHRALAEDEDALVGLNQRLATARAAREDAQAFRQALRLTELRAEVARLDAELRAFPDEVALLIGEEAGTLDDLEADRERLAGLRDDHRRKLAEAEAEIAACGLPDGPPDPSSLDTWRARARGLRDREAAARDAERAVAVAHGELDRCRRELAGERIEHGGVGDAPIDAASLEGLDVWWGEHVELDRQRRDLAGERRELEALPPAAPDLDAEREALREGGDALRAWRAAPAHPRRGLWIGAGLALGVGVAGRVAVLHPVLLDELRRVPMGEAIALIGGSIAMGLAALLAVLAVGKRSVRKRCRKQFEGLDLEALERWDEETVDARLGEIESRLAAFEVAASQRDHARVRLADIDRREGLLADREAALDRRRSELARGVGVDPGITGLGLADLATRLRALRVALRDAAAAEAERDALAAERDAQRDALCDAFRGLELPEPDAADEAESRLDDLARRCTRQRQAERTRDDARARIRERSEELETIAARRRQVLARVGLEDADPHDARRRLEGWLDLRPSHAATQVALDRARAVVEQLGKDLAQRPELTKATADTLRQRLESAERVASDESALVEQIADVEARARQARQQDRLEQARADEHAAAEALAARRDEALRAEAGQLLLDTVAREHEQTSRPAVLERAMASFAAFTHHRFALDFHGDRGDRGPRFRAVESDSERPLDLDALSDGTRTQLLLAARLAFAASEEPGSPLPLFLDEALTASDPERFAAVAEGLLALVAEGRQVFYLTCEPDDAERWAAAAEKAGASPPRVIDLAAARRGAVAVSEAAALRPPPRARVPEPAPGESAADYGVRLGVPAPAPFAGAAALHLFHVLRDDLALLHRVLAEHRIETVGQWRAWARSGGAGAMLEPDRVRAVDAAADLADAFFDTWAVGRGLPVERSVLADCRAVTATFLDRLDALAEALGRDARRFCAALEEGSDERLKRFSARNKQQLCEHLAEAGVLDDREPFEPEALRGAVVSRLSRWLEAGVLDAETVTRRVDELRRLLA